jgi:hypothetical protein
VLGGGFVFVGRNDGVVKEKFGIGLFCSEIPGIGNCGFVVSRLGSGKLKRLGGASEKDGAGFGKGRG